MKNRIINNDGTRWHWFSSWDFFITVSFFAVRFCAPWHLVSSSASVSVSVVKRSSLKCVRFFFSRRKKLQNISWVQNGKQRVAAFSPWKITGPKSTFAEESLVWNVEGEKKFRERERANMKWKYRKSDVNTVSASFDFVFPMKGFFIWQRHAMSTFELRRIVSINEITMLEECQKRRTFNSFKLSKKKMRKPKSAVNWIGSFRPREVFFCREKS